MRGLASLLLAAVAPLAGAYAQDVIHLVGPGSKTSSPAAPDIVAGRIAAAARQYQQYAPIPRVAFFDIAYPADTGEYGRMVAHGVLLVTAFSQANDELPVTPYLRTSTGTVPLRLITSVVGSGQADSGIVRTVFGPYRVDALYLIPLDVGARGADLLVDFARNRQGFKLGVVSPSLPPSLHLAAGVTATGEPKENALLELIRREYPGFVASR